MQSSQDCCPACAKPLGSDADSCMYLTCPSCSTLAYHKDCCNVWLKRIGWRTTTIRSGLGAFPCPNGRLVKGRGQCGCAGKIEFAKPVYIKSAKPAKSVTKKPATRRPPPPPPPPRPAYSSDKQEPLEQELEHPSLVTISDYIVCGKVLPAKKRVEPKKLPQQRKAPRTDCIAATSTVVVASKDADDGYHRMANSITRILDEEEEHEMFVQELIRLCLGKV